MLLHSEEEARVFVAQRCDPTAMARLTTLVGALARANEVQNLVAAATLDWVWLRHIADSAQLLDHVSRETGPWIDLGSGAGFPGLVIAAMKPDRPVILIESRRLRVEWLETMAMTLNLVNCRVIGQDLRRVETFSADVISARAFAPLPRLVEFSARFSTNGTEWVLPKGRSAAQDIAQMPKSLQTRFHVKQSVTDAEAKIITAQGKFPA